MVIIQYLAAIIIIIVSLKVASYFTDVHPDGYKDMVISFSVPYLTGAVIYYISLGLEVRKQNQILEKIKQNKK
ncbi:MAG: hypothetical protein HFH68_04240 [Lachnospiraceae bacterium]|nr:hypothetical protein [Lachnospiraceae bacterium]